MPERRSYHTSFTFENKLYIYGGLDIQTDSVNTLWELDLSLLPDLESDDAERRLACAWRQVPQNGKPDQMPGNVAYHSSIVFKEQMYLFGGNNYSRTVQSSDAHNKNAEKTYTPLYSINLKTFTWFQVKTRGEQVKPRDEHTAVLDEASNSMVIFGGFEDGERTNEVVSYNLKTNQWTKVKLPEGAKKPCPRSGHSACVQGNMMYIFGGKSDNATKLNDLWAFNMSNPSWQRIKPVDEVLPETRSGHSAVIYDGVMLVFGGILEVTKELNDVCAFSIS